MANEWIRKVVNGQIGEYKSAAMDEILFTDRDGLSEEIITALDPQFLEEPTGLIYYRIFPYMRIPDTVSDTGSYILMSVDVPKIPTTNRLYKQVVLTLKVMVHQDAMYMGGKTNRTRCDYIAERLYSIFNGNRHFNGEPLNYDADIEGTVMNTFHTRTMRFSVDELNQPPCTIIS